MLNKEMMLMNTGDLPPEEGFEKYYLTVGSTSYTSTNGKHWTTYGFMNDTKYGRCGAIYPTTFKGQTITDIRTSKANVEREPADGHDVEAQTADTALGEVGEGLSKVKAEEVGGGLGRNRRVTHKGTDQQQDESQHQKNDRRIVVFDNEVREQYDCQQRNDDAKHSTSPLVIVVM